MVEAQTWSLLAFRNKIQPHRSEARRIAFSRHLFQKTSFFNNCCSLHREPFSCLLIAVKEWEWMDENPVCKINKPKLPQGRIRFLNELEKNRLLEACKQSNSSSLYPIVVLALSTGMRKGEILTLTWDDIDLDREAILLQTTKNGERRLVPLTGLSLQLIKRVNADRNSFLVFPSPNNPSQPLDIRSAWERALRKADIINFKFHDLRHTAASYLAMNNASLIEIGALLGHKTVQMTKRYAHLSNSHLFSMTRNLNNKLFDNAATE